MTVTIDDVTSAALMSTDLAAIDAAGAVDELAALLEADGRVMDRAAYVDAVLAREQETGGTGMESGIAIPHAKSSGVARPSVAFGRSAAGVDFGAEDGTKSDLIFLIAAPEGEDDLHVTLLSRLARRLIHEQFRTALRNAETPEAVFAVIK
ncbi:MAG: PTS sugar transporter subunit IIA, partial [Actinomycetota bacterium]